MDLTDDPKGRDSGLPMSQNHRLVHPGVLPSIHPSVELSICFEDQTRRHRIPSYVALWDDAASTESRVGRPETGSGFSLDRSRLLAAV